MSIKDVDQIQKALDDKKLMSREDYDNIERDE